MYLFNKKQIEHSFKTQRDTNTHTHTHYKTKFDAW